MVTKLPPNAGDTGSNAGSGRFHTLLVNSAREPQPLKPACLEHTLHSREAATMRSLCITTAPPLTQAGKA